MPPPQYGPPTGSGSHPLGCGGGPSHTTGRPSEDRPWGSGSGNALHRHNPNQSLTTNRINENLPRRQQNNPHTHIPTPRPNQPNITTPNWHHWSAPNTNRDPDPQPPLTNQPPEKQAHAERKTRANIKIASLNVKGRTSTNLGPSQISKWATINREMRDQKIGILCAQETHLCPEHQTQIDMLYKRRIAVLNSSDPTRPGNSAGIAFILNKEIINTDSAKL